MKARLHLALALTAAACGGATEPVATADPCANWNSQRFFAQATAQEVQACIQAGRSTTERNDDLQSPLCMAAQFTSDPEVIRVLIRNGASIHDWCAFNGYERSPCSRANALHVAAAENTHPEVIQALIDAGVSLGHMAGPGWTPLSVAWLWHAPPEVVAALERNGATGSIDINTELCGPPGD